MLQWYLNGAVEALLGGASKVRADFAHPVREEALVPADSQSWRVFKNPLALFVGGTAAVVLELAEPAVRAGVWEHSCFRYDPVKRLRRTGLAAMISVFGAQSVARTMIERVVRMHASVHGTTAAGVAYSASDPRLLTWVHSTAVFGFAEAYHHYVRALSTENLNDFYREGAPVSRLYGAVGVPRSATEMRTLIDATSARLTPSTVIFEFLGIMRETPALPQALRWMQPVLVRAAVELIPARLRTTLGLSERYGLRRHERRLAKWAGACADRLVLPSSPPVQSCVRLGLPMNYLYV
jgi:uncharacterized protein (DUF2236 family)